MPKVLSTTTYDTNLWEPVKLVTASHNEAISGIRDFALSITQIFGGKMELLDKKLVDLRTGVIKELEAQIPDDTHMIIGVDFETNILERTMIVVASGTLLRKKKNQSGGKRRTRSLR
jgi:uncharacterized protein YbjQ (UPF0145 family)